jgi:hypothetical protein
MCSVGFFIEAIAGRDAQIDKTAEFVMSEDDKIAHHI